MATIKDFRKWISFNNLISNHDHLYDLYTAVNSAKNKGSGSINHISNEEESIILIE